MAVDKATRLRTGQFGVRVLTGKVFLSLLQNFQNSPEAHPASHSMSNCGSLFGGTAARA